MFPQTVAAFLANPNPTPLQSALAKIEGAYPTQYEFVTAENQHLAFIGGVGAAKTYGGAIRAARAALGFIGDTKIKTPNMGMATAPTWQMITDSAQPAFYEVADEFIAHKSQRRTVMTNGSEVLWRSLTLSEHRRGPNLAWWWGDEAAMYDRMDWLIMVARLRQLDGRGYSWMTTTPKGRNWLWSTYIDRERDADWRVFTARTKDNPFLAPDYYEMLAAEYHGDFARQELEAEFIINSGLIYHFDERHILEQPPPLIGAIAGVDWGFVNPGCIIVIGLTADDRAIVVDEMYRRETTIPEWAEAAVHLQAKWGISSFFCDPSDPRALADLNQRVRATSAQTKVLPGIRQIQSRLAINERQPQPRLQFLRRCANTLSELKQYQWRTHSDGRFTDDPVKANDHAMDAMRYALFTGIDYTKGAQSGKFKW